MLISACALVSSPNLTCVIGVCFSLGVPPTENIGLAHLVLTLVTIVLDGVVKRLDHYMAGLTRGRMSSHHAKNFLSAYVKHLRRNIIAARLSGVQ